jgi:hypothetical protein
MRIVEMTRDMRPWAKGQDAVLSDELAARLLSNDEKHPDGPAAKNSRPFPPPDVAPRVPVTAAAPVPPTKSRYMTRKRG